METTIDSLKRDDRVVITVYDAEGKPVYKTEGVGFHSLDQAIGGVIAEAGLSSEAENCVFEVRIDTTGVTHRYRLNAHGNLKRIV